MKAFQRILAVLLCLVMSLGMISMVASAATTIETTDENGNPKTGSITIHKYEYNGTTNETNNKGTGLASDASKVPNDANNPDDLTKTAKPLAGVTFTIYQVKDTAETVAYYSGSDSTVLTWDQYANADGSLKVDLGDGINSEETNSNGVTSFTGLNVGIYLVVENTAPGKVTQKAAPFLVSIPMTNPENESEWMYEVHVFPKNKTSVGSVTLNKVDENGIGLAGVTFELKKEVTTEDNKKDYVAVTGDLAAYATRVTEDGGVLTYDNLTPGNYSLTEISAPAGYIVDSHPIYFTVTVDNTITCTDNRACINLGETSGTKNLTITLINEKPDMNKKIVEGQKKVQETNAGVGSTVKYEVTVDVPKNITKMETFTLTDTPEHLNDISTSIIITCPTATANKDLVMGTHYTVTPAVDDDASTNGFKINFTTAAMADYAGKQIVVTYDAVVLASAATEGKAPNTANLTYSTNIDSSSNTPEDGDNWYQIEDRAIVYTYMIVVDKRAEKADGAPLPNVEFELYNSNDEKIHVINTGAADADGNKPNGNYRLATATENADGTKTYETGSTTTLITGVDGKITVTGLNSGTYKLKETKTVAGYNLLNDTVDVDLNIDTETSWNTTDTFEDGKLVKHTYSSHTYTYEGNDAQTNNYVTKTIVNKKGFTLPQTGGIGTLMFIIIGGVLMAGGICLIVPNKKRAV